MSKSRQFDLPAVVRSRALSEGEEGRVWLAELDDVIAGLAEDWDLTVGRTLEGGSASFVARAKTGDGQDVVLKIGTPISEAGRREAEVLLAARGQGYVRLLRHDLRRRALLLEHLGQNLEQLRLPLSEQIETLCATLLKAWMPAPASSQYVTGREKAARLSAYIDEVWEGTGRPCSSAAVQMARRYALQRGCAFDTSTAVLAHGDPHAGNILVVPATEPMQFKLVDPDGLCIERAYDLGVMLRDWNEELLTGDTLSLARKRTQHVAQLTGVEEEAI